ncbi:MAG: NADH-quinone reductase, partial [Candidatus Magnetomorum sp.]|nr:NADH-quinone reductase [Candidatus Magnetomorum sp.]
MKDSVNQTNAHQLTLNDIMSEGKSQGTAVVSVKKLYWGNLLTILIGAIFVQNYVFVKYLGLCVYLGVTQKKSTAIGMGITFTIVIMFSTTLSWFLYQFILKPFQIEFLQIIVFIGLVSLTVQAVDTILRKVNPILFKEFGVYLVLIISSCLILAVPLIMAAQDYDFFESLMLSSGAGLGFFLAMFLMSCVRERI